MTSSNSPKLKNIPSPNEPRGSVYSRFIPREELSSFASWTPGSLSGADGKVPERRESGVRRAADVKPAKPPEPPPPDPLELQRAARQSGYQDGYRDGLAALEQFKQSFAAQMTQRLSLLVQSHGQQLDALQHDMARTLAGCAISLTRQMVRSELAVQPECVATVAQEAVEALLQHARHISVRVHPDDLPLVAEGAGEVLKARHARLMADSHVARGGCLVESDMGAVDASIEARWLRAAALLGSEAAWNAGPAKTTAGQPDTTQPETDDSEAGA